VERKISEREKLIQEKRKNFHPKKGEEQYKKFEN
jgi:hypothetical protein